MRSSAETVQRILRELHEWAAGSAKGPCPIAGAHAAHAGAHPVVEMPKRDTVPMCTWCRGNGDTCRHADDDDWFYDDGGIIK
jgi:hypothetical protein